MKFWVVQAQPSGWWEVWSCGKRWASGLPTEADAWAHVLCVMRAQMLSHMIDVNFRLEAWEGEWS